MTDRDKAQEAAREIVQARSGFHMDCLVRNAKLVAREYLSGAQADVRPKMTPPCASVRSAAGIHRDLLAGKPPMAIAGPKHEFLEKLYCRSDLVADDQVAPVQHPDRTMVAYVAAHLA
jgi:hypothetical protein